MSNENYLGKFVNVVIDRPLGSKHPNFDWIYPVNYGFIPNTVSGDGEEIDVYVLGVEEPIKNFKGICIATIHRINDDDDKLIVIPEDIAYLTKNEIEKQVEFQEKWFKHELIMK
ncbi:MAG TPA: inorganic diphosphatase [Rickettsiales bacterium]|nr:inorganic diphosphatase [Rickettsiales bacterium]